MGELFHVGEKFRMLDSYQLRNIECASVFEALPGDNGYIWAIFLKSITEEEIKKISSGKIQFGIYTGDKGYLYMLVSFEDNIVFESSFDPTLYNDNRALQITTSNNQLQIVLVESETLEVQSIREYSVPLKLGNVWAYHWEEAKKTNQFSSKYAKWVKVLENRYDTEILWNLSKKIAVIS